MKYLHYLPVAIALAALVATVCNKEIEPSDVPVEPQDEVEIPEGFVKINVAAENEQASKTSVSDAGAVTWNVLDEIKFLYAGGDCTATTATAGASASFSAVVPESGDLYAVYPSSIGSLTDGTISVTIPSTQDGSFANGNFSAAQVNRSTNAAAFQNITAFLKFTVSNSSVKRIDVESADNSGAHLTGDIDVTFSDYAISLGELSGGGGRVRLNIDEPGTYYVAVAPGLTHGGLSITYYTKDGDNYTALPPYHYNKSITFERNKIKDFGDLYPNPGHLYVSVNGSGTKSGFDAANAMDFERWKTRVVPVSSDNTNTNIAQRKALSGVTFHFAAGTYSFPQTSPINVGSYTGSGIEFTLSGEDGGTIFSGEVSGAATGSILKMGYGTLNIENIIFEYAATTANTTNGAIYVNNKDAIVNLTNCIFRNNGNSTYIGGSIDMYAGTINATGCTFTGNGGKQASCLEMNSTQAAATFTNCTFASNTVQPVRVKNGTAVFSGCAFSSNSYSSNGGAIYVGGDENSGAANVTFNGCTFTGNSVGSNSGGAIYAAINSTLTINNSSSFSGNTAKYGNCIALTSNASLTITNTTFSSNTNSTGSAQGGAIYAKETSSISATSCIFTGNQLSGNSSKGGAVYLDGSGTSRVFTSCVFGNSSNSSLKNSVKTGSSGGSGGAINVSSGNAQIYGCEFYDNEARWGGNISSSSSGTVTISDNNGTFTVIKRGYGLKNGGGIYVSGNNTGSVIVSKTLFEGNHDDNASGCEGGAICVDGNTATSAKVLKVDRCIFKDNYAYMAGALFFNHAAANSYINDCVFTGNYIQYASGFGTTMEMKLAGSACFNNCTFADDTRGNGWNNYDSWIYLSDAGNFMMSNCSVIGKLGKKGKTDETGRASDSGLIFIDTNAAGPHFFINNIIADNSSTTTNSIMNKSANTMTLIWNKMTACNHTASPTLTETNNCTDYKGTSSYFGGLGYTTGSSWDDSYWGWNGTLATGSNTNKALLSDINTAIQSANGNFYSWLDSIGALDKDGRGKTRGSSTWPGAYDGTNN